MHTRGSQLVPELLLKLSYTLHIQYRYLEHVHEEVSCKEYFLAKWLLIYNLAILYDMFIDSAYRGIQLVPQLMSKQFNTCLHNIDSLNICMKKFDEKKMFFDKITAF